MVIQQAEVQKRPIPIAIKVIILIWMFAMIFTYHILFGSQEFWSLMQRLGIDNILYQFDAWLQPFFTADYLS
jgi:hypothetical protein